MALAGQTTGLTNGPVPITGLTIMANPEPEATPEERYGGPADPRHAELGERAHPYPWERTQTGPHGPYGLEALIYDETGPDVALPASTLADDPTADLTPYSAAQRTGGHAAPWPKGLPRSMQPDDDNTDWLIQRAGIHQSDTGAGRKMLTDETGLAIQDSWVDFFNVEVGTSLQVPVPQQTASRSGGFGHRDRTQSQALQNSYGFDSSHYHRRYAVGSIPGNYMWLQPGSRPLHKSLAGPAKMATGQDSPFTGDDITLNFNPIGAVLMDQPTEYQPVPAPALSSPASSLPDQAPLVGYFGSDTL